jgi:hypothetical protein
MSHSIMRIEIESGSEVVCSCMINKSEVSEEEDIVDNINEKEEGCPNEELIGEVDL